MALINAEHLTKTYESEGVATPALQDVSFHIDAGEFVAIMGPSGSGKSTLLHLLGLLDRPTAGSYRFNEQDTRTLSDSDLALLRNRAMGFIFQTFNLLGRTSVLDNVQLPLLYAEVPAPERADRARSALALVDMGHRASHLPSQLSGGEQQRVAIARALVNNPRVIFADEPTGNLDSASGALVMRALEDLHRRGHTILLITHETYTAEYAQRIVRLRDGQLVADAPVTQRRVHEHFQK